MLSNIYKMPNAFSCESRLCESTSMMVRWIGGVRSSLMRCCAKCALVTSGSLCRLLRSSSLAHFGGRIGGQCTVYSLPPQFCGMRHHIISYSTVLPTIVWRVALCVTLCAGGSKIISYYLTLCFPLRDTEKQCPYHGALYGALRLL